MPWWFFLVHSKPYSVIFFSFCSIFPTFFFFLPRKSFTPSHHHYRHQARYRLVPLIILCQPLYSYNLNIIINRNVTIYQLSLICWVMRILLNNFFHKFIVFSSFLAYFFINNFSCLSLYSFIISYLSFSWIRNPILFGTIWYEAKLKPWTILALLNLCFLHI